MLTTRAFGAPKTSGNLAVGPANVRYNTQTNTFAMTANGEMAPVQVKSLSVQATDLNNGLDGTFFELKSQYGGLAFLYQNAPFMLVKPPLQTSVMAMPAPVLHFDRQVLFNESVTLPTLPTVSSMGPVAAATVGVDFLSLGGALLGGTGTGEWLLKDDGWHANVPLSVQGQCTVSGAGMTLPDTGTVSFAQWRLRPNASGLVVQHKNKRGAWVTQWTLPAADTAAFLSGLLEYDGTLNGINGPAIWVDNTVIHNLTHTTTFLLQGKRYTLEAGGAWTLPALRMGPALLSTDGFHGLLYTPTALIQSMTIVPLVVDDTLAWPETTLAGWNTVFALVVATTEPLTFSASIPLLPYTRNGVYSDASPHTTWTLLPGERFECVPYISQATSVVMMTLHTHLTTRVHHLTATDPSVTMVVPPSPTLDLLAQLPYLQAGRDTELVKQCCLDFYDQIPTGQVGDTWLYLPSLQQAPLPLTLDGAPPHSTGFRYVPLSKIVESFTFHTTERTVHSRTVHLDSPCYYDTMTFEGETYQITRGKEVQVTPPLTQASGVFQCSRVQIQFERFYALRALLGSTLSLPTITSAVTHVRVVAALPSVAYPGVEEWRLTSPTPDWVNFGVLGTDMQHSTDTVATSPTPVVVRMQWDSDYTLFTRSTHTTIHLQV